MIRIPFLVASLVLGAAAMAQSPCSATFAGAGCGGALDITFTPQGGSGNQRIDIRATGLLPDTHGIMVWGANQANIPLGSGCNLLVEFAWGHTILTNSLGEFQWSRSWPASAMPGHYYIQIGSFGFDASNNFVIVGTDAKLAACQ